MITKKRYMVSLYISQEYGHAFSRTLNTVVLTSRTQVISLEIPTRTVRTDVSDQLLKPLIKLTTSHAQVFKVYAYSPLIGPQWTPITFWVGKLYYCIRVYYNTTIIPLGRLNGVETIKNDLNDDVTFKCRPTLTFFKQYTQDANSTHHWQRAPPC